MKAEIPPETVNRRKTIALRRFNMLASTRNSLADITNQFHTNQSTLWTTNNGTESAICRVEMYTDIDISHTNFMSETNAKVEGVQHAHFYIENSNSQDSGLGCDKDSNDGVLFAAPTGIPLRRNSKRINDETWSPLKISPVKEHSGLQRRNSCPIGSLDFSCMFSNKELHEEISNTSPLKLCRLTSLDEGISDDGYDCAIVEPCTSNAENTKVGSTTMSYLFNAPIVSKSSHASGPNDDTPVTRRTCRNIQQSVSMEIKPCVLGFKRAQPDSESPLLVNFKQKLLQDESIPNQELKRPRSFFAEPPASVIPKTMFHRCHSMSEAVIKSALNRHSIEPNLVGDFSKAYCLPTYTGKHQDLRYISRETLSDVLDGSFAHIIEQAIVIDCRYPYEYHGGHIRGSLNLYTNDQILEEFFKKPVRPTNPDKRLVLIFHCEFSSERGPRLSRFLRRQDRQANKYPDLHYPELYLLDGGYKAYFETEKHQCVPQEYKTMLDKAHTEDLRLFRTKSKSWPGEQRGGRPGLRTLKF